MKRQFTYITVGKILDELKEEGINITRVTFVRLEKRLEFPQPRRTTGQTKWRTYSREQANLIKRCIKQEYSTTDRALSPAWRRFEQSIAPAAHG